MKAKVAASILMDEDQIAPKERVDAVKTLYIQEFKTRMKLRFPNGAATIKSVIPLWKEMSYWAGIVLDKTKIAVTPQELDDIFKAKITKDLGGSNG